MTIMLKLLPRVQFTDPIIDHDSFQVQEHPKSPSTPPSLMVSSQVQVQFKKFKITFTVSPFCKYDHPINHLRSISLYIFVTNCLYYHRFLSFSSSSSTPVPPNKLGCSIQTRFTWCAKQLLSKLTQQITSLGLGIKEKIYLGWQKVVRVLPGR